jgi:hypothetical protein
MYVLDVHSLSIREQTRNSSVFRLNPNLPFRDGRRTRERWCLIGCGEFWSPLREGI